MESLLIHDHLTHFPPQSWWVKEQAPTLASGGREPPYNFLWQDLDLLRHIEILLVLLLPKKKKRIPDVDHPWYPPLGLAWGSVDRQLSTRSQIRLTGGGGDSLVFLSCGRCLLGMESDEQGITVGPVWRLSVTAPWILQHCLVQEALSYPFSIWSP